MIYNNNHKKSCHLITNVFRKLPFFLEKYKNYVAHLKIFLVTWINFFKSDCHFFIAGYNSKLL